jgi:ABC-type Fe3+-hydroxamate transport system substrate-binding protein
LEKVKNIESYKNSPAVKNNKVIGIDAVSMERQSRRMTDAAKVMAKAMYPAAFTEQTSTQQSETTISTSIATLSK